MTADSATVHLAVTTREFRVRHRDAAKPAEFEVDRDVGSHLVDLYRFRRRYRQLEPSDVRGCIWFAMRAAQR